jgi:hypothetical protein
VIGRANQVQKLESPALVLVRGIDLGPGWSRLLLAWKTGRLVARVELNAVIVRG